MHAFNLSIGLIQNRSFLMHVLIPLYPERRGSATEIRFPTGWDLYYISKHSDTVSMTGAQLIQEKVKICSFKECCSLKFSVYGWKKKILVICHFPSKLIHYVWYVISPALVIEIRRNNSNTCTTAEETLYKKYQFIKYKRTILMST